jgi:hypothetical protein
MLTIYDIMMVEEAREARVEMMSMMMRQQDLSRDQIALYCETFGSATLYDTSAHGFNSDPMTLFVAAVFYMRWDTVRLLLEMITAANLNLGFRAEHPIAPHTHPARNAVEIIEWTMQSRDITANSETDLPGIIQLIQDAQASLVATEQM